MDEKQTEPATGVAGESQCPWGAGATLPRVAVAPRIWSNPASPEWGTPHRGCPAHSPACQGAAGCCKRGAGICQSRSNGRERVQDRMGSSLRQPPASLLLWPEPACSASSLHCSMPASMACARGRGQSPGCLDSTEQRGLVPARCIGNVTLSQ